MGAEDQIHISCVLGTCPTHCTNSAASPLSFVWNLRHALDKTRGVFPALEP